ncbi:MAG: helix-turn-helix domain-containing protein [Clostridia bacterium]|nr:helix-turn-helix domain-containing protein [Oscillospiraceae bacterium]MBR7184952.1 helix-turn-helix domain-containing protein [Clostridia bacterium]
MFNDYGELLTVEEACEALRIGHNTIYELLNSGKLKGYRCGRVWKIPRLAIEQYVLEQAKLAK